MDPVTIIVTAIAAGAAAGFTDTAKQVIADSYSALKGLISGRYQNVDLRPVEAKPDSAAKRASLAEDLTDAGADADDELLTAAQELIHLVRTNNAGTGHAIGVDLERVEAAALRISDVRSQSSGVKVRDGSFSGDIDIRNIRAGSGEEPHPT
ncbi:hypothetical protein ACQPZ2_30570 [Nocardia pseudovaccinii]|uniref:hypothetical protein n=1 Tax=Nocardia pseudovaccinii TaxID=189540 RepID=UPI003D8CBA23